MLHASETKNSPTNTDEQEESRVSINCVFRPLIAARTKPISMKDGGQG